MSGVSQMGEHANGGRLSNQWVLLTDDSPTVCRMLTQIFMEMGYSVQQLENYLELPRLLRQHPPALVILDLERPGGLSGEAVGRFVRQYQPREIPILVFSSLPASRRQAVCEELLADASVGKGDDLARFKSIARGLLLGSVSRLKTSGASA